MISDLQIRLFTSILQNSYFDKLYELLWRSHFSKLKSLRLSRKWWSPFSMLETLRVLRNWWSPFSVFKSLRQWWCIFSGLQTLRVVRKQRSPVFSIKNFKSCKAVVELSLSFKNFKSRQKMTVRVLFQWSRFIKLSYDNQISWSNILSVCSHWISLIIITF